MRVVQTLIHFHAKHPFTKFEVRYASNAAIDKIVEEHWKVCMQQMKQLLEATLPTPQARALCGYIFELHALKLLQKGGGEFECRKLVEHREKKKKPYDKITVPKSPKPAKYVEKVDINQEVNQLHVPKRSNYASIDAWIPGFGAFQGTAATTHGVKGGLTDDIAMLGVERKIMYWRLPPTNFHSFIDCARKIRRFRSVGHSHSLPECSE